MQPRPHPLQLQHLRIELFTRRPVARRHSDAVSKQHPDQRAVAHADPEHKRVLSTQTRKIFIYTVIHGQTFLVLNLMLPLLYMLHETNAICLTNTPASAKIVTRPGRTVAGTVLKGRA